VRADGPVRVFLVGPSLDILGGQAVQASRLLAQLRTDPALDVEFLPVNPRLPGPLRLLQRIKYVRTVSTSIAYVLSLLAQLRRADVVHAFSASYWSYLLAPLPALAVGRLLGKATVLNYRSGEAEDHLARGRVVARPSMRRLADRIVVPSGYLVKVFGDFGLRATAIPNFIDPGAIPYRPRVPLRPVFLSNRNLESLYDVATIVRAFAAVQREFPEAALRIAGDGPERGALERLVAELDLSNVTFLGRVPPELMGELLDGADVYLNSPRIDNMPTSIIEAWAAGLPVVSTNAGGIPYLVRDGETGLLVGLGDDRAMASATLRLLRDPEVAERLARRSYEECMERYVWPAVGAQWRELYVDLARGSSSSVKRIG
jgi:L-malate glycosyltransferase